MTLTLCDLKRNEIENNSSKAALRVDRTEVAIKIMLETNLYSDSVGEIKLFSCWFSHYKRVVTDRRMRAREARYVFESNRIPAAPTDSAP